jgi:hypothetical protein
MTRSSERLTGNWKAHITADARPVAWSGVARHLLEGVALVSIIGAVFGFR